MMTGWASVYQKLSHWYRYVHGKAHHYPHTKRSVVNALLHRAISFSQPENHQNELDTVRKNKNVITRRLSKNSSSEDHYFVAFLPYVTDRFREDLEKTQDKNGFHTRLENLTKTSFTLR